jgi:hypothetical protein
MHKFDNICKIINSNVFSRHLETYYGQIRWLKQLRRVDLFFIFCFSPTGNTHTGKMRKSAYPRKTLIYDSGEFHGENDPHFWEISLRVKVHLHF